MFELVFILSLILVIYVYIGYPLCIFFLAKFFKKSPGKDLYKPGVTILISAYNEEEFISETIYNKLSQDYPEDALEIIVISDESMDKTDQIVQEICKTDNRVKLLRQEPRQGKTAALNMAMQEASGEIIVFSDANSIYANDAITKLVRNFSDSTVGYATGKMVYTATDGSVIGDGCSAYMRYENFIRQHESDFNSIVGVDGGIDAVRKELYRPMKPDQLPDFVLPLMVVNSGYRVIYEPEAVLKETSLDDYSKEFRMRVRVSLRALWAMFDMRVLFNPVKFPVFSWQLISHKVFRYLAWIPLSFLLALNPFLLHEAIIYQFTFFGQLFAYGLATTGYFWKFQQPCPRYIILCYYFVLINIAAAMAFFRFLNGKKQVIWSPRTG